MRLKSCHVSPLDNKTPSGQEIKRRLSDNSTLEMFTSYIFKDRFLRKKKSIKLLSFVFPLQNIQVILGQSSLCGIRIIPIK